MPIPLYEWRDTIALFTQPRVAINGNDIAAATFRRTTTSRIFGDYQSQIDLIAVDVNNRSVRIHTASPYVCDTTAQVYAYDLDFANNSILNIFLHEQRAMQGKGKVHNGIVWGNPDMKLVLRSVSMDNVLQLQDVPEDTLVIARVVQPPAPLSSKVQIQLYPSPAADEITLTLHLMQPAPVSATLYTLTGEKLADVLATESAMGTQTVRVPLQHLSSGMYLFIIQIGNQRYQRQFFIIR